MATISFNPDYSTIGNRFLFNMSRSSQEAFALVTCALCATEFFRKDRSGILIENHQPNGGSSSTSCAICPTCAVKIRENDPYGQIKDLDEIREGVKRMQDYTEGLEEAYDELLDELEQTQAEKAESQKKLDVSRKLIQDLKREAAETQKAKAELQRKLQEVNESVFKEDWKRKYLEISNDMKDMEQLVVKIRERKSKGHTIDVWQHSVDETEIRFVCAKRNDGPNYSPPVWRDTTISYGISSNNKLLAVTAEGGTVVKIFHIKHGIILYNQGFDFRENGVQPKFSKLTKDGRYLVSIIVDQEQPEHYSVVIHDFGDDMEHAGAPLRSIVPGLNISRLGRIQLGFDIALICNRDESFQDLIIQLSTNECFEFQSRGYIEMLSMTRFDDYFSGNLMIGRDRDDGQTVVYKANFQQKQMLQAKVVFFERIYKIRSLVVHPFNQSIIAGMEKLDGTKFMDRRTRFYLRITGNDNLNPQYITVSRGRPPPRILWHPGGRYIVCVGDMGFGRLDLDSLWWYDFERRKKVGKRRPEIVPRMLFEKARRHFKNSPNHILDVAFSRDGNSLIVTHSHRGWDDEHEYLKIFTVTES